jgi:hypothetical protein
MSSIQKEVAIAKNIKLMTDVKIEISKMGLRPTSSDNLPKMGDETNCIRANDATSTPNAVDPTPNVVA